jgi:hypothetical protein
VNARSVALAALVAVTLTVSGCAGSPEPVETTPAFTSEEEAFAAAEETYRAYVDALNQVDLSAPETFEPVFALTTGDLNSSDREGLSNYHAENMTVDGASEINVLERRSVDLNRGEVVFDVCLDVSTVQLVRSDGSSAVDPDRVSVQSLSVSLEQTSPSSNFRVSSVAGRDGDPLCE